MLKLYHRSVMHRDYFRVDDNTREFIQQMLFLDYMEDAHHEDLPNGMDVFVYEALNNDMQYYIAVEEYEMTALLADIIKRFKG